MNQQQGQVQKYKSKTKIIMICLNLSLAYFYFGYCLTYLATIPIDTVVLIFPTTIDPPLASGLLNGCIPIGGLMGALASSLILKHLSRKNGILFVNALATVTGAMLYIPNIYTLILFRLVQGYCVGSFTALGSLLVKQISPRQLAGSVGSFSQLMVGMGMTLAFFINYCLKKMYDDISCESFWQILFAVPFLSIIVQSVGLLWVFPYETPKYLLLKGREEETRELLAVIYKDQYVDEIFEQKLRDIEHTKSYNRNGKEPVDSESIMTDTPTTPLLKQHKTNRIALIVGLHVAILQQFSGICSISVYCNPIAANILTGQLSHLLSTFISLVKTAASLVCSLLIVRVGRKTILESGLFMEGVACLVLVVGFYLQTQEAQSSTSIVMVGLFLFVSVYGFSLGPITWLYIAQVVQPKMLPFTTAANWIASSTVIILFPIISEYAFDNQPWPLYVFFALWNFGALLFSRFFVLQTKGKSQKQIREMYASLIFF